MKTHVTFDYNKPSLYVDDKLTVPVIYALSDFPGARSNTYQAMINVANFAKVGIDLVEVDVKLHYGWHKVSDFDTEPMREEIACALDANENAKVIVRLHLNPPYWWLRDNLNECVLYRCRDGESHGIDDGEQERLITNDNYCYLRVSLASEKWKKEAGELMVKFMESIKGTREGDSLVAIQVACGMFGEWHHWGYTPDVSVHAKNAFKKYLKEKYVTEDALKKAWGEDVTFDSAYYTPELKDADFDGTFRNPKIMQSTIDSMMSNQKITVDTIEYFARLVKETMPDILCGSFYGYYFNSGEGARTIGGHLSPHTLFREDSPVDFLCGPFPYYGVNREPDGLPMQRTLLESMRLNKKLWITEMDQHPAGMEFIHGGDPERIEETKAMLWRNTLQPILAGEGFWYYDHRIVPWIVSPESQNQAAKSIYRKKGWWDNPVLMDEIKKIQNFCENVVDKEYSNHNDVLVVYDTESFYYRRWINQFSEEYMLLKSLAEYGASYDCIYEKDLDKCDTASYKCIIFANCHKVDKDMREKHKKLSEKSFVIMMNCYGYCDGESLSEENIFEASGIRMKKTEATHFVSDNQDIELKREFAPFFEIVDKDAEPLAYYENGKVAAAVKGNTAYSQIPFLTKKIAGEILNRAGVHSWCDSGEPVMTGFSYMAINCQKKGTRTVCIPGHKPLELETNGYETVIYDIKTGERI